MDCAQLIEDAAYLSQVSSAAALEFSQVAGEAIAKMNMQMNSRDGIEEIIGRGNLEIMEDNHKNHARFMESIFYSYDPVSFVNTVLWVFRVYQTRGFQVSYWVVQLTTWLALYRQLLSVSAFREIAPFYEFILAHMDAFAKLSMEETLNL